VQKLFQNFCNFSSCCCFDVGTCKLDLSLYHFLETFSPSIPRDSYFFSFSLFLSMFYIHLSLLPLSPLSSFCYVFISFSLCLSPPYVSQSLRFFLLSLPLPYFPLSHSFSSLSLSPLSSFFLGFHFILSLPLVSLCLPLPYILPPLPSSSIIPSVSFFLPSPPLSPFSYVFIPFSLCLSSPYISNSLIFFLLFHISLCLILSLMSSLSISLFLSFISFLISHLLPFSPFSPVLFLFKYPVFKSLGFKHEL